MFNCVFSAFPDSLEFFNETITNVCGGVTQKEL